MSRRGDHSGHGSDVVHERTALALVTAARRAGIPVDLDQLAPGRHEEGGERVLPTAEYDAVVRHIFRHGGDDVGVRLAEELPVEAAGLWGFVLRTSPTFGGLLRRAKRFERLFFRYTRLELDWQPDRVALRCLHPRPGPFGRAEQEVAFFLGQWLTWARRLVDPGVVALEVRLQEVPDGARERWAQHFGVGIETPADADVLVLGRDVVDRPIPDVVADPGAPFEHHLSHVVVDDPEVRRIAGWMAAGLLTGHDDETSIAERLGITRRTLRRHLAERGVSYRELRRQVLEARAKELLAGGELPVREIAVLLGYADMTAFLRAFRGWTGRSPRQWCAEVALPGGADE